MKKVRPESKTIPGLNPYYCDVCVVEWLLKDRPDQILCPDCGKTVAVCEVKHEQNHSEREDLRD